MAEFVQISLNICGGYGKTQKLAKNINEFQIGKLCTAQLLYICMGKLRKVLKLPKYQNIES